MSARILAATAMPAASSAALLIRLPEAKRSMAFSRSARFSDRIREAVIDEIFVLTTTPMTNSRGALKFQSCRAWCRGSFLKMQSTAWEVSLGAWLSQMTAERGELALGRQAVPEVNRTKSTAGG